MNDLPLTLNTLIKEHSLAQLLTDTEAKIRAQPMDMDSRWVLFQVLCLMGQWSRALRQLPMAIEGISLGAKQIELVADGYRRLITAELARHEVFGGMRVPEFDGEASTWMLALAEALALENLGNQTAADARRQAGLEDAPTVSGCCEQGQFTWLADADSRLGPVLEVLFEGRYLWLGLDQVRFFTILPPSRLIDLVWTPIAITLCAGQILLGHLPARYVDSENGSDALRLGHETLWHNQGETAVIGLGRKMWMSDVGEWGFFDLGECQFTQTASELSQ